MYFESLLMFSMYYYNNYKVGMSFYGLDHSGSQPFNYIVCAWLVVRTYNNVYAQLTTGSDVATSELGLYVLAMP